MTEARLTVGDWMTPDPVTVDEATSVEAAIHLLAERHLRHLPVMRAGRLVGLVTEKALLGYMPGKATSLDRWELHHLLARTPVSAAVNPTPHTVTPETPLADAARLLHDRRLDGVLVVDARGDLVGIFTTTDALEALAVFAGLVATRG
jgi:acetoin utilization protein AcuB